MIGFAVAAPLLAAAPAAAQWYEDGVLPPHAIVRLVTQQGFAGVAPPRLQGGFYVVNAVTAGGERVRLFVDARDGRIVRSIRTREGLAPERVLPRVRPRGDEFWPEDDYEMERDIIVRRVPRYNEPDLLPPRSVGRPRDEAFWPDDDLEHDMIPPYRAPAPTTRIEPAPERRRTREAARPSPSVPPRTAKPASPPTPAPAPAEASKPEQPAPEKATAAVPAPTTTSEPAPAAAPPVPSEAANADSAQPAPQPEQAPAAQAQAGQATSAASAGKVRVIEGVTPIQPQPSAQPQPATSGGAF